jgi:DNA topoisomerase-2
MQVSWLAGYAVEQAAYNHGQQSAEDTIISMAHDFVGSNNLNLLMPLGKFGSRDQGGLDNADGCDLFTCLSLVTRLLFPEADDILLNNLEESGRSVEPIWYCSQNINI